MRRAAALALVAALALTGCGRLADREADTPPSISTVAPADMTLDEIQAQLDAVDDAVTQSSNDLAEGDEAAANE